MILIIRIHIRAAQNTLENAGQLKGENPFLLDNPSHPKNRPVRVSLTVKLLSFKSSEDG